MNSQRNLLQNRNRFKWPSYKPENIGQDLIKNLCKKTLNFSPFKVLKLIITLNKSTENVNIASMFIIIFLPFIVSKPVHRLNKTTEYLYIANISFQFNSFLSPKSCLNPKEPTVGWQPTVGSLLNPVNRGQDFNISNVFFQFFSFQISKTSQNIEQVNSEEIFIRVYQSEYLGLFMQEDRVRSALMISCHFTKKYKHQTEYYLYCELSLWQVLKLNISICRTI